MERKTKSTTKKQTKKVVKKQTTKKETKINSKKKKGFTLIELLAVIIILGILMIIAIPSVTKYISDSRKSAYVDTARQLIGAARNIVNSGQFEMYDTNTTYYIDVACIKSENATKSPYGDFVEGGAYVVVTYDGKGYTYYWTSVDDAGQGIKEIIRFDKLDTDNIESDLSPSDISTLRGIDGRGNTVVIRMNNATGSCTKDGSNPINTFVNGETGEESEDPICNGVVCICKRAKTLHTATCSRTSYGCYGTGYYVGGSKNTTTVTYGNLGMQGGALVSGDALDCDVNNDGTYDPAKERFYYVTDKTTTNTNDTAVLLYFGNINNDGTTITAPVSTKFAYDSSNDNWHGPRTLVEKLPSTTQWSNSQIIAPMVNRQITNQNGGTLTNIDGYGGPYTIESFTYEGKAARLLTYQEIQAGCNKTQITSDGSFDNCHWLMENVPGYTSPYGTYDGYWLETPVASARYDVWSVHSWGVRAYATNCRLDYYFGVRPVIEVLKSSIAN